MFRGKFQWLSALPLLLVTGALAILAIVTLAGAQSPDARSREMLFDFFQRLHPAHYEASDNFHLVLIDRESIDQVGPWPWPRTVLAELVEKSSGANAKGIILAEPVDSPDPLSPESIGKFWLEGASDQALREQLSLLPQTDQRLADAFENSPGAVAVSKSLSVNPHHMSSLSRADAAEVSWLTVEEGAASYFALPPARYAYAVNESIANSVTPAVAALYLDTDGDLRRLPLLWSLDSAPAPSLALQAAAIALDTDEIIAKAQTGSAHSQGKTIESITVGDKTIPTSPTSSIRLYLPKRLNVSSTSAARLLGGSISNSQLSQKVIIIGLADEIGGAVQTARGKVSPAALYALASAQIAHGDAPRRPGWTGYLEALSVMIFGAAAIMTAQRMQFWQAIGFAAIISLILIVAAFSVFAGGNVLINPLAPATALFLGALSVAGGRSIGGVLRDDSLRGSFHDTLPEPAMKRLRDEGGTEILHGIHRDLTVLACELRIADEDLRTLENLPDDVTKLMASASLDLRQTIIDTGGVADQAEGGRIFAYYNTPTELADHAVTACAAALRLIESMDKINTSLEGSSVTRGIQMHLAIGIATGRCFTGPMGHGRNNRYSAIGFAVDRAAFLRSQSEFYGPAMICDEAIYRHTHHQFAYLELDKLSTRNAERPFSIYALIGNPFIKSSKGFRDLEETHRELLAAYRAGDFETALEHLAKIKKMPGAKIDLFEVYEKRIHKMKTDGAPTYWEGVHPAQI